MQLKDRLRTFFIGVLLGSVAVYFILIRGRDFPAWTPNDRVIEALLRNPIEISPLAACQMQCLQYTEKDVLLLLNSAKVDFKNSKVRGVEEKSYLLRGTMENQRKGAMYFREGRFKTYLLEIDLNGTNSPCICP